MTDELFADLPVQHAPATLTTDNHTLERCDTCLGAGRVFRWRENRLRQVKCRPCAGFGKIIRPIGDRR